MAYLLPYFALISSYSLFISCPISSAETPLSDDAFVAFVRGPQIFEQFCEEKSLTKHKRTLAQFYGIHLALLMRRLTWALPRPPSKYRHILYEYFFNIYAEREDVVRPMFALHEKQTDALRRIGLADAVGSISGIYPQKIVLQNMGEIIAADQRGEQQPLKRDIFGKIMGKMLAKLEAMAKEKRVDHLTAIAKCLRSFDIDALDESEQNVEFLEGGMKSSTLFAKGKGQHLQTRHLAKLYLMRKNWQCANAIQRKKEECEETRRIMNIVHEYAFRVRHGIAAEKPIVGFYGFYAEENECIKETAGSNVNLAEMLEALYEFMRYFMSCSGQCFLDYGICTSCNSDSTFLIFNENELNYAVQTENENSNTSAVEGQVFEVVNSIFAGNQLGGPYLQAVLRKVFEAELDAAFKFGY